MVGAEVLGSYSERAYAAIDAGCDMILVCNNQSAAIDVIESLQREPNPASQLRLIRMHGRKQKMSLQQLHSDANWQKTKNEVLALEIHPELGFGDDGTPT